MDRTTVRNVGSVVSDVDLDLAAHEPNAQDLRPGLEALRRPAGHDSRARSETPQSGFGVEHRAAAILAHVPANAVHGGAFFAAEADRED
ncbi:MAG: hypothetical protein R3B82_00905 [Sandaracinaceae bacterium]